MEQVLASFLGSDSHAGEGMAAAPVHDSGSIRHSRGAWIWLTGAIVLAVVATIVATRQPAAPTAIVRPDAGPASVPASPATYTVNAALYRIRGGTTRERIDANGRVRPGDELALEFKASIPVHVYVINEDDHGRAYALFPLPDSTVKNPLPADTAVLLPGEYKDGKTRYWKVDSAGGREHLLVLASPDRLVEFEAEMNRLPRPSPGISAVAIPPRARLALRGIGEIVEGPDRPETETNADATSIFEMAERLAGQSEVARGPWLRRIDLDNPANER